MVVFAAAQQPTTVVGIFRENDSFSTLLQDIDAAGLSEEFLGDSAPWTCTNTLEGTALVLDIEEDTDSTLIINNVVGVTQTDIVAGNGVVQVISAVLMSGAGSDGAKDTM